jgi:hypothetical protein
LDLPIDRAVNPGYYHATGECWALFTEVQGVQYGNVVRYQAALQPTVDTYAVQHAGGNHPDKSVAVHLTGLHLHLVRGLRPGMIAPMQQQLASAVGTWPHYPPPDERSPLTIFEVAMADTSALHLQVVRDWSESVWALWVEHHDRISRFISEHLFPE